jgi:hypothetical protein
MPGFGDPPKEFQFTSENQPENRGKKKGSKNFKTVLRELLEMESSDGEWASLPAQVMIEKMKNDRDLKAAVEAVDRMEGKSAQSLNIGGQSDNPLGIEINIKSDKTKNRPDSHPTTKRSL